jgi:peptidoglycan hydrolase-like protein with peptidoglycan-binding domain
MRKILTFTATLAIASLSWAQQVSTPAKPVVKPPAKPAAIVTTATAKRPVSKAAVKPAAKKAPIARTTWRTRQAMPTSDRYKEIQEALVARGYLTTDDVNGAWGAVSTDALKKFQAEQTLETTGKIDSLSLIALGLGPKHDNAPVVARVVDGNVMLESGHNQ